jgi:competence protein ComEA
MILTKETLSSDQPTLGLETRSSPRGQYSSRPMGVLTALFFLALTSLVGINSALAQTDETGALASAEAAKLDINLADAESLAASLVGIGLTKAREIVRYRELHGDFVAIEELAEVKGIGLATVEKNRHLVLVVAPAMDGC